MENYDLPFDSIQDQIAWLSDHNPAPIVCLCGSTRFKAEFEEVNRLFTMKGYIVLTVGAFMHSDSIPLLPEQKTLLDALHKSKIQIADFIYVVNPGNYIGESTKSEISFASSLGLPIFYHDNHPIRV